MFIIYFKEGLRQCVQDHKKQCPLTKKKSDCRSCKINENCVDQWDLTHRGATLMRKFQGKSMAGIIKSYGWAQKEKEIKAGPGKNLERKNFLIRKMFLPKKKI